MARSLTTTDHDTIRKWTEERGGKPSEVASTARGDDVGIIRIDFPGFSGEGKLQEVSWDDWFKKFDEANLAFVYEEETADGQRSNFNKLVGRETAEMQAEGVKTNRRAIRSGATKGAKAGGARPGRKASRAGTSRQATGMEAARTARAKRTSRGSAAASGRGSAASRKRTSARKGSAAGRSSASRSSSGGTARKTSRGRGGRKSR